MQRMKCGLTAGKTLIARQIGKLLNAVEPKIVNGPEILDKYVGESEKKVRELFADAERDEAALSEESPLHVIIFDEIDAICKQRGSTGGGTGVHDSIVNTLLTKIDGVESLNNILLIGAPWRGGFAVAVRGHAWRRRRRCMRVARCGASPARSAGDPV